MVHAEEAAVAQVVVQPPGAVAVVGDDTMKCLVCNIDKSTQFKECKMCGMRTKTPLIHRGAPFCCNKCIKHFEEIVRKASPEEEKLLQKREVII